MFSTTDKQTDPVHVILSDGDNGNLQERGKKETPSLFFNISFKANMQLSINMSQWLNSGSGEYVFYG